MPNERRTFQVGDCVRVIAAGHKPEEGVIERSCTRPEWDWWIKFSVGDSVPYLESELELLDGT